VTDQIRPGVPLEREPQEPLSAGPHVAYLTDQPDVLRRAKRVGPDSGLDVDADLEPERELEPWELPLAAPPAPRLEERSVEEVFARLRGLTLAQSRAFQRAYESIPSAELDLGGWAQPPRRERHDARATLDDIVNARALLRDGARREARANGADVETEAVGRLAREAVVEALSHASLRGGGLEEATVAAQIAAEDVVVALTLRQWIAPWRFDELAGPWVTAFSIQDTDARSFDVLGLAALALGVMAFAALGMGRTSLDAGDLWVFVFAALAVTVLLVRWRLRRQPAGA
jgi:hypothetical protein